MHVDRRGKVTRLGRTRIASASVRDGLVMDERTQRLVDAVAFRMLGDPDLPVPEERARALELLTGRVAVIDDEDRELLKRVLNVMRRHMAAEVA